MQHPFITRFSQAAQNCFRDTAPGMFWFTLLFFYFLYSQLMSSSTFVYNIGFYALLLPAFLYAAAKRHALITGLPVNYGTMSLALFFLFVIIHSMAFEQPQGAVIKSIMDTLFNVIFLVMTLAIFHSRRIDSLALLRPFILIVIIFGALSLLSYYGFMYAAVGSLKPHLCNLSYPVFVPIGRAHNPIPIDNLYAMGALLSLWLFFQPSVTWQWKVASLFCASITLIVIFVSMERGPLLALGVAGFAGLIILRQWRWLVFVTGIGLLLGADFVHYFSHHGSILHLQSVYEALDDFFFGKDSYRGRIWIRAHNLILERPWEGHGLQTKFTMLDGTPGAVNPHNIFLATLYYLGIPGFILFLTPLLSAFYYALRNRESPYHQLCFIFLVHAVVATFTNYGQAVKAPAPLWTIYWLPIAMAIAHFPRERSTVQSKAGAENGC